MNPAPQPVMGQLIVCVNDSRHISDALTGQIVAQDLMPCLAAELVRRWNCHGELVAVLRSIISDLPSKRDWLDPQLEAQARSVLTNATEQKPINQER